MATQYGRQSFRLRGFDYSLTCGYFLTVCTQSHAHLLGRIVGGEMLVNSAGIAVRNAWWDLQRQFAAVEVYEFIVMPNHFHGMLRIVDALPRRDDSASDLPRLSLADVVRAFKSLSAIAVNRALGRSGPVWQRNYFEHILRNEKDYLAHRNYIWNNPRKWESDPENKTASAKSRPGASD